MNVSTIKISVLWLLLGSVLFLSGCASKKAAEDTYALDGLMENMVADRDRAAMTPEERFVYDYRAAERASEDAATLPLPNLYLVEKAKTALGTPYVRGGPRRKAGGRARAEPHAGAAEKHAHAPVGLVCLPGAADVCFHGQHGRPSATGLFDRA